MTLASWLPLLQTVVAALTILGIGYSVWRGTLRQAFDHVERIPNIEEKVDEVEETQEKLSDAVVLLTHAQANDHVNPDPEAVERDLRDQDEGPARYASDGVLYEDPSVETEDEQVYPESTDSDSAYEDTPTRPERDEP
jgi:hypothetical protein